jgi:polyisoprenoid-binding protein YceI
MRFAVLSCLASVLLLCGCGKQDASSPATAAAATPSQEATADSALPNEESNDASEAAQESSIALTPENTTIQFVGTHADPNKPDPRTGRFSQFSGSAIVDGSALKSLNVEIETASLTTEIEKLTNHLKSVDFFDVNEHPKATFTSTSIEPSEEGNDMVTITGDLTLLGETQSISFPATVRTEDGFELSAEFSIDRTQFGMDYGADSVLKDVQMSVTVVR